MGATTQSIGPPLRSEARDEEIPGVGTVIDDKYRVDGVLGQGGMGVVLAATHTRIGQLVAIKIARASGEWATRLVREAQFVAKLQSPHVVRVLDASLLPDGRPFVVLEQLAGRSLARVLDEDGPLPPPLAVGFLLQAIEGLAEAHAAGLIHRDIKPSNLFVCSTPDGRTSVKVLDFGIAKAEAATSEATLTGTSGFIGSVHYASPEQVRRAHNVSPRSDLWSLGVTLYELLSKRRPFEGEGVSAVMAAIVADPPTPLLRVAPSVPRRLAEIVGRCLAKDPAKRFLDVAELARALTPFCEVADPSRVERLTKLLATRVVPVSSPERENDDATARAFDVPTVRAPRSFGAALAWSLVAVFAATSVLLAVRGNQEPNAAFPAQDTPAPSTPSAPTSPTGRERSVALPAPSASPPSVSESVSVSAPGSASGAASISTSAAVANPSGAPVIKSPFPMTSTRLAPRAPAPRAITRAPSEPDPMDERKY